MKTLPNGMRYYVRANKTPAKRAMLWLAVNAGSIQEDDDQLGFAHFLEHMAFNGTRHFPGNTLIDVVEQAGMRFGQDLNASTNFDETIYKLTMPTDDPDLFRQGLQILEDWATGGILMDSMDVVGERGVVMGEWRMRGMSDTVRLRSLQRDLGRWLGPESRYVSRFPIGDTALLTTATPAPLQRFYRDWYRPDRMAVIVVGDFDPTKVEKEIIARFGRMPAPTSPRAFNTPVALPIVGTMVQIKHEGALTALQLNVPITSSTAPKQRMRDSLIQEILFPYVQRTYTRMARQDRRPFTGATIANFTIDLRPIDRFRAVSVGAHPDSLLSAFAIVLTELQRVAQHGIPSSDLTAAKAALIRQYEQMADGEVAISSQDIVEHYTRHYLTGFGQLWSAQQSLQLAREVIASITSDDIARAARFWESANRKVSVQWPRWWPKGPPPDTAFVAVLDSIQGITVTSATPPGYEATPGRNSVRSLLDREPPAGTIVNEQKIPAHDLIVWTLSNGARVVWKPSSTHTDELVINAYSLGGQSLLHDSLYKGSGRMAGIMMSQIGGLGHTRNREELGQELSATGVRELRVALNVFDEEVTVSGSVRELETLFQLLYLQMSDPTVDTTTIAEWRRTGGGLYVSPNDQKAMQQAGGHPRMVAPYPIHIRLLNVKQGMTAYHDRFGDASDFTFFIVGAASSEQVKPLVQRYLASLPSTNRATREKPKDYELGVMTSRSIKEMRSPGFPAERAQTTIAFQGRLPLGDSLITESEHVQLASWIVSRRLRNRLREQMAVVYSVGAPVDLYYTPDPRYLIQIQMITAPESMPASIAALWEEIETLRTAEPTEAEIRMAASVIRRQAQNARQNNRWWIDQFQRAILFDLPWEAVSLGEMRMPTGTEIRQAVNRYFHRDKYIQQTVLPTEAALAKKRGVQKGE